jgi:GTP cyclohydrolase II
MPSDTLIPVQATDAETLTLRQIHRAASELRRGVPVVLNGWKPLVLLAAETAGADAIRELIGLGVDAPLMLMAPIRAAGAIRQSVDISAAVTAVRLPPEMMDPDTLHALADPTADQPRPSEPLVTAPLPPDAIAALNLVKLGRLLPAIVAVTARAEVADNAERFGLVSALAEGVLRYPTLEVAGLKLIAAAPVPMADAAEGRLVAFRTDGSGVEHLAIVIGRPEEAEAPLVRIHSECFTGDLMGSLRCDCGEQLRGAIQRIAADGAGVVLYLAQEGRGIGLVNKLRAYTLQDRGLDTLDANRALGWGADERNFMIGSAMLSLLGIPRIRLLTNNPEKVAAMEACGVKVIGREEHEFDPNGVNNDYLKTKAARFGHMLGRS